MKSFLPNNKNSGSSKLPLGSFFFILIWLIGIFIYVAITTWVSLSSSFDDRIIENLFLVIQHLSPTFIVALVIIGATSAFISITTNFYSSLKISLKNPKFLTFMLAFLHLVFAGFFYQVALLYLGFTKIPISLVPCFNNSTLLFSIFDIVMLLILGFLIHKNSNVKSSSIELEQSIQSISFNGSVDTDGNDSSAMRKSLLFNFSNTSKDKSDLPSDTLFYLQNDLGCTFMVELKNFDYENRTSSQLNSIQNALSDLKKLLDSTKSNVTIDYVKISHVDVNEFDANIIHRIDTHNNQIGAKIDRIFLQYSFDFTQVKDEEKKAEIQKNARDFLKHLDYLFKQNVKMYPILPGRLVMSQWFKFFEHNPQSKNQNSIIARLKLLDHYLNVLKFGKNHAHYDDLLKSLHSLLPNEIEFIEKLSKNIVNHQFKLPDSLLSSLNSFISFSFSKLENESSIVVKFYKQNSKDKKANANSKDTFSNTFTLPEEDKASNTQYLSVYNAVEFDNFDIQGNEFNSIFKNSGQDTVTFTMSTSSYKKTEEERQLKFNSLLRYKQVNGRFKKEIISADEYHKNFVNRLVVLIRESNFKTEVKSFVFKKVKSEAPIRISTLDLFITPQKLDYMFDDNPGFTYRLIYGQNKEFFDVYINKKLINSPYLGDQGFMTSSDIFGYIGPFTQDTSIDRASSTRIYIGKNIQSELEVSVDMSEYRNSDESVGNANGHIVVIGKSGSGKTYLTESLLFQKGLTKNLYIFDIENEYNDVEKSNSKIINLLRAKDGIFINPSREANAVSIFNFNADYQELSSMWNSNFKDTTDSYKKSRKTLISFIKEITNNLSNTFDSEIGYCIDQTYNNHYQKKLELNQSKKQVNLGVEGSDIKLPIISQDKLKDINIGKFLSVLFEENTYLNSEESLDKAYILYPRIKDFQEAIKIRLGQIKELLVTDTSKTKQYEYLIELLNKIELFKDDEYLKNDLRRFKNEALKVKYLDEYNLLSEDRVINMFDLNSTDDQLKMMLNHTFKEQSLVYQKHRDFLVNFIKELVNIHSQSFDVEIGYCIDQTYSAHYAKHFKDQPSYDPNIFNSIQYFIDKEKLEGKDLETLLKYLFENNKKLSSAKSLKDAYVLYPRVEDFKSAVKARIEEIKKFTLYEASQINHLEYLYELDEKLGLLLEDDYWNKKFNRYSNVSLNKEVIIFNLKSLLNISGVVQFSKWSLMLLLNFLFVTTFDKELDAKDKDGKGIFLVIDEAHRYLRPELMQMVDFMADISKRGRKRYVEMCIVSQNISDFYRESDSKDLMQKARDVVRNSAYKFIFQIGSEFKDALQFIEAGFQITEADQNYIKQLYRGQCYFVQGPLELTKVFVVQDPRMPKKA